MQKLLKFFSSMGYKTDLWKVNCVILNKRKLAVNPEDLSNYFKDSQFFRK